MQNPISLSTSESTHKPDVVRFLFPRKPELMLYALGTVQNFVDRYMASLERVRIWQDNPGAQRELQVAIQCDQRFYLALRNSFPPCCAWEQTADYADDMCVTLTEDILDLFELLPTYSTQWLMGQLAGTLPRMVPDLGSLPFMPRVGLVLDRGLGSAMHAEMRVDARLIESRPDCVEIARQIVSEADMIVARQGLLTVMAVCYGKPVVEVTDTASRRSFLSAANYVQVSRLSLDGYFQKSLERGVAWLKKNTSQSGVSNVDATSQQSTPPAA